MSNVDPLAQLFVSESQPINRQDLTDVLLPYVTINKETKSFDFSGDFMGRSNADKILIILCAIKARSLVLTDVEDKIIPSEIIKLDVAPEGSIKATLKILVDSGQIKSNKGKYYLPNYKVSQIAARFKNVTNK